MEMLQVLWQRLMALVPEKEEGQGLVEYALILVLISVVSIAIMTVLGTTVSGVFSQVSAALVAP